NLSERAYWYDRAKRAVQTLEDRLTKTPEQRRAEVEATLTAKKAELAALDPKFRRQTRLLKNQIKTLQERLNSNDPVETPEQTRSKLEKGREELAEEKRKYDLIRSLYREGKLDRMIEEHLAERAAKENDFSSGGDIHYGIEAENRLFDSLREKAKARTKQR